MKIEFGTNGVRGVVGETMTPELAVRLGRAVATLLPEGAKVLVGRDARDSGPMLQSAFTSGLLASGIHVDDAGIAPSPALQLAVRDRGYDLGAIITASHNPPPDNGIKLVLPDGTETDRAFEDRVEQAYAKGTFPSKDWTGMGRLTVVPDVSQAYVDAVLAQVDVEAIRKAKLRVVLDPGGGAGCWTAPALMEALGVDVIRQSCTFDGAFSDRPSEPTPKNAKNCIEQVVQHGADFGVLQDGDADRAIFIADGGEYVWGDTSLALACKYELQRYPKGSKVCTAVSSSSCVKDATEAAGGHLVWTVVGSPIVAREMMKHDAVFGGEDNGGLMFTRHQICRDGLMAMAFMAELVATTGKPLSALVQEIPKYALNKDKVAATGDKKAILHAYKERIQHLDGVHEVDDRDGVKAYLDGGWVLVRPSGTEPIFRIQSEAATLDEATQLAAPFKAALEAAMTAIAA